MEVMEGADSPSATMTDIVRVLESDVQGVKDDKKISQEDLNFLKIMEEGIERTRNGHYEMPLPFKEQPVLPDNHAIALIRLEHLQYRSEIRELRIRSPYAHTRMTIRVYVYDDTRIRVYLYAYT